MNFYEQVKELINKFQKSFKKGEKADQNPSNQMPTVWFSRQGAKPEAEPANQQLPRPSPGYFIRAPQKNRFKGVPFLTFLKQGFYGIWGWKFWKVPWCLVHSSFSGNEFQENECYWPTSNIFSKPRVILSEITRRCVEASACAGNRWKALLITGV